MTLGQQLRSIRLASGKSQRDLVSCGVAGQSTISEVENDTRPTTSDVIERWVSACGGEIIIRRPDSTDPLGPLVEAARALSPEQIARLVRIAQALPALPSRTADVLTAAMEGAAEDAGRRG